MMPANITIIGLGLIGGSLAKALHDKLGIRNITAVDPDAQALELALEEGVLSRGFTTIDCSIYSSDVIFLCAPVKQTLRCIDLLASQVVESCIITDVCSTKEEIIRYVEALPKPPCFIGGHPMAGTEKSGYANSLAHLFENAYYVLTPSRSAAQGALDTLTRLVEGMGAIPVTMSALEHDRVTGSISHLPHVIAAALVNLVEELDSGSGKMQTLAAGGFRDITRIASSNPGMWENIVFSNREQVVELISLFGKSLQDFSKNLNRNDSDAIYRFFDSAKQYRESISSRTTGLIQPDYRLVVDVQDRPGIIGEIATILGNYNINIKNIHVTNSREFEQGCLIITLPDPSSVNNAFDLLIHTGYKVYRSR